MKLFGVVLLFIFSFTVSAQTRIPGAFQPGALDQRAAGFKAGDLTYKNPGCSGALTREQFLAYLKSTPEWIPAKGQFPFDQWRLGDVYESATPEQKRDPIFWLEEMMESDPDKKPPWPVPSFVIQSDKPPSEPSQLLWIDIDGDGRCDVIGRDLTSQFASGVFETYSIFLQRDKGFRLIDVTAPRGSRWGDEKPDPLLPIWIAGDRRPFLVARQELFFFGAGWIHAGDTYGQQKKVRTVLRWDPASGRWLKGDARYSAGDRISRQPGKSYTVTQAIADFLAFSPPPGARCPPENYKCRDPY